MPPRPCPRSPGGQPTGPCEAGVTRRSDGSATVLIVLPMAESERSFRGNQATGYAEGRAEGGIASVVRVDDLSLITTVRTLRDPGRVRAGD